MDRVDDLVALHANAVKHTFGDYEDLSPMFCEYIGMIAVLIR